MKTRLFLLIVSCFVAFSIVAQDTKTGKDESSVVLNTTNVGFDPGKASLTFKTNNLSLRKTNPNSILWGITAEGKNNEGISSIFSSSEIVPSSKITLLLGFSTSNADKLSNVYLNNLQVEKQRFTSLSTGFKQSIDTAIYNYINDLDTGSADSIAKRVLGTAYSTVKKKPLKIYTRLKKAFKILSQDVSQTAETRYHATEIYKTYFEDNPEWKEYKGLQKVIKEGIDNMGKDIDKYKRTTFYLHHGNAATKFNVFKGWDSVDLTNSFEKITFRGSSGGFGINRNYGSKWIIGFRYTYEEANNLEDLETSEYKVTQTNTTASATGATELKKTAYPNTFRKVFIDNLDFDIMRFFPSGKESIIIANLYIRDNISSNEEIVVNHTDIGISGSLFNGKKGKFIGGVYLEVPDVGQNRERRKPADVKDLDPFYQRLNFGVFTKFSFSKLTYSSL